MNINERIAQLEAELAELKNDIKPRNQLTENDIGRLVEVRDVDTEEWRGPVELDNVDDASQFWGADIRWHKARLYHGKFKINLTHWQGGECPCAPNDRVIVKLRSGELNYEIASMLSWTHRGSRYDILGFAVVEV